MVKKPSALLVFDICKVSDPSFKFLQISSEDRGIIATPIHTFEEDNLTNLRNEVIKKIDEVICKAMSRDYEIEKDLEYRKFRKRLRGKDVKSETSNKH